MFPLPVKQNSHSDNIPSKGKYESLQSRCPETVTSPNRSPISSTRLPACPADENTVLILAEDQAGTRTKEADAQPSPLMIISMSVCNATKLWLT